MPWCTTTLISRYNGFAYERVLGAIYRIRAALAPEQKNHIKPGPRSGLGMQRPDAGGDGSTLTLHKQMKDLAELFERTGITYWVDSGTLLGLIREGGFIEWDKDIDLSVWAEDLPALNRLRPELKEMGYDPWPSYMGPPYVLSLVPKKKDGRIAVNIGGHFKNGDTAYRLVWDVRKNKFPRKDPRHWINEVYRFPLHASVFLVRSRIGAKPLVGRWPWTHIIDPGYWAVPIELLEETKIHGPSGLRIPARAEEYLELRYGDWRVPVKDWDYQRDDGAYHSGIPGFLQKRNKGLK